MMDRRSFLTGTASLILANLIAGCSEQSRSALNVRILSGSIPPQVLGEFRKYLKQSSNQATLNFSPEAQLQTLFSLLQRWKQQNSQPKPSSGSPLGWIPFLSDSQAANVPDLITLGDYWLAKAIQQRLIQPLNLEQLQGWTQLQKNFGWQKLVTRNDEGQPDPKGKVWAAPYRWGSTVIVYRKDIFKDKGLVPPSDWNDLWRPELSRQISLLDQPREVIGLTLKKLGKSYNTTELDKISDLKHELDSLRSQVKLYSSDAYLQPLLLGDTWLAVGWSTDVLPLTQRSQTLAAIVPKSGTALWADLWVRPYRNAAEVPSLVTDWISFCWQPKTARQLSLLSQAASPAILVENLADLPAELRSNPLLLPDAATLEKSEFLYPLPESTVMDYQELWKYLRQVG